ncbi:PWI domain [Cryptosporidium xiaoi]|uniref:PWI domain n=1 Tax=Cryptosporidium xiaoi TaxID=659607 RepID=A0AAV9Y262_9CRYT
MNVSEKRIDFSRIPLYKVRKWVHDKIGTILGSEDEILVDYCMNQLIYKTRKSTADEEFQISPKEFLENVKGFLGEHSNNFVSELWDFLYKIALEGNFEDSSNSNRDLDVNNDNDTRPRGRKLNRGRGGRNGYRNNGYSDGSNYRRDMRGRNYNDYYSRERYYRDDRFRSKSPRKRYYDRRYNYSRDNNFAKFHVEGREVRTYGEYRGSNRENRDHRENRYIVNNSETKIERTGKRIYRTRSFSRSLSPFSDNSNSSYKNNSYPKKKYRGEEYFECGSPVKIENASDNDFVVNQLHSTCSSGNSNPRTNYNDSTVKQKETEGGKNLTNSDQIDIEEKLLRKKALEMMRRRNGDNNTRSTSEEKLRSIALEKLKEKKLIK